MRAQLSLLLAFSLFTASASATTELTPGLFSTTPRENPNKKRNLFFPQIASLLLPSFDQWWEDQQGAATIYLSTGFAGLTILSNASTRMTSQDLSGDYNHYDDLQHQYAYGAQLYMLAGELSAYHSFRTAMKSRQSSGQFEFLKAQEDVDDLLLAPFAFSEALKPTTFIPLAIVAALAVINHNSGSHTPGDFTLGDAAFTVGTSYNAGVGEEALFRGYMMPMFRQGVGSDFWSNASTSVIFGAAHLSSSNKAPVIQTLIGFYLGWLSQRNDWSLRQSVFLHAWWDVVAIGASMASQKNDAYIPLPALTIPF